MLILMILYMDSYLQLKEPLPEIKRFFEIAARLPEELQALISNRSCGLTRDTIPHDENFDGLLEFMISKP